MKMFLSMLIIFISMFMFFLNHPFSMGLMILIQTLLLCLLSSMLINTYWFSYILFLVFLGGLMVLFIYVSSIASNELFKISFFNKKFFLFISFIFIMNLFFMKNLYWMNFHFNDEMMNFFNMFLFFNNEFNMNISKLYNNQTYFLTFMMIIYLFITLIAVIKITNIIMGPLRTLNF